MNLKVLPWVAGAAVFACLSWFSYVSVQAKKACYDMGLSEYEIVGLDVYCKGIDQTTLKRVIIKVKD